MKFIETSIFTKKLTQLLSDDEYRQLQNELAINPLAGALIQGTGGLRKIRWSRPGMGKRGGIRTIYYFLNETETIYMLLAYPKNEKDNLSDKEKKILRELVKGFKNDF